MSPQFSSDDPEQRLIKRALHEWRDELPDTFAAHTAAVVAAEIRGESDRLESWLQRALIVALVIATVVAVFWVGGRALAGLANFVGKDWIYTAALCVGLSLVMQLVSQHWLKKRAAHA